MSLWSTCIVYKPELLQEIFDREELSSFLLKDGLLNADLQSRAVFKEALNSVCTEIKSTNLP